LTSDLAEQRTGWHKTTDHCGNGLKLLKQVLHSDPGRVSVMTYDGKPAACDINSGIEVVLVANGEGYYVFPDVNRPLDSFMTDISSTF